MRDGKPVAKSDVRLETRRLGSELNVACLPRQVQSRHEDDCRGETEMLMCPSDDASRQTKGFVCCRPHG